MWKASYRVFMRLMQHPTITVLADYAEQASNTYRKANLPAFLRILCIARILLVWYDCDEQESVAGSIPCDYDIMLVSPVCYLLREPPLILADKRGHIMARRKKSADGADVAVVTEPEPPKRRRGPRAGSENARRGGMAVREKYGPEFFAKIGAKGGRTVRERRGPDFYATIGRLGGQTTRDTLGVEHYERIGRMGGLRARRREREARETAQSE